MEERYSSLEEEAAAVGKKLKQLWAKFRAAQSEVQDLQVEQQQEKEDLLQTVRELTRQLQLQNLVIESFIPPEEARPKLRAASCKLQATSYKLQAASCKLQATSYKLQATSYKLQATSYKVRASGYTQVAEGDL